MCVCFQFSWTGYMFPLNGWGKKNRIFSERLNFVVYDGSVVVIKNKRRYIMVFLDESGHTGTERYINGKWNMQVQPYFVLAAVVVEQSKINILENSVDDIMKKYKIQKEIKSTSKTVRKYKMEIMEWMLVALKEANAKVLIEVVNKKYCICEQITNYCVVPYYSITDEAREEAVACRKVFANYLFETLSDEFLGKAVEFFDSNTQDVLRLLEFCHQLAEQFQDNRISSKQIHQMICDTIDDIENYEKMHLKVHNLFPLADRYRTGYSTVVVCPQVDCLNNLVYNRLPDENIFIHDEIKDIDAALQDNIKSINGLSDRKVKLSFEKSVDNKCIQIADFFAGMVRLYFEEKLSEKSDQINCNILQDMLFNQINFVSSFKEQSIIFSGNEMLSTWKD